MNSKMVIGVVVILLLVVGGYYYFSQPPYGGESQAPSAPQAPSALQPVPPPTPTPVAKPAPSAPTPSTLQPVPPPTPTPVAKPAPSAPTVGERVVEFTAGGFSPSTLTVLVGTTVKFVNKDTQPHWPASGVHPTHLVCPGLDALKQLQPGDSYSFTFKTAKTCPVHDHLNPATKGTIVVQ